jgi:hypothetical protein
MESHFQTDLAREQLLAPYLDRCYTSNGFEVKRCYDLDEQHDGVDVWLTRGDERIAVDEKAQLHFVGQSLPTFALEVEYFLADQRRTGWLYHRMKRPDAYAFVFDIRLSNASTELITSDSVTNAYVILVGRKRLRMALMHDGLFESVVHRQAELLRTSNSSYRWFGTTAHKLVLSTHLAERPVNLVVRRTFLENIGESLKVPDVSNS